MWQPETWERGRTINLWKEMQGFQTGDRLYRCSFDFFSFFPDPKYFEMLIGPGSMTLAGGGEQREAGPGRAFFLTAGSGGWGAHTALATAGFLVF